MKKFIVQLWDDKKDESVFARLILAENGTEAEDKLIKELEKINQAYLVAAHPMLTKEATPEETSQFINEKLKAGKAVKITVDNVLCTPKVDEEIPVSVINDMTSLTVNGREYIVK